MSEEKKFIPFHEVAIKSMKGLLKGNLTNIRSVSMIYYYYGPLMTEAPKKSCQELINSMKEVFEHCESLLSDMIPTWKEEAYNNLRYQLKMGDK